MTTLIGLAVEFLDLRDHSQTSVRFEVIQIYASNGKQLNGVAARLNDLIAEYIVERRVAIENQLEMQMEER